MRRVLLVNPPIYDFSAYDFWLRPLGLLRVGGWLRSRCELHLFDFLDRHHPSQFAVDDRWGRGRYPAREVAKPAALRDVRRRFHRFGLNPEQFAAYLDQHGPFDAALVSTAMTYWYPGVCEVIQSLRAARHHGPIVLGGVYATLCPEHAATLGADLVIPGNELDPLWSLLAVEPDLSQPPFWEGYSHPGVGVLKLTDGCPFRCTYCSVPQTQPRFRPRPTGEAWRDFSLLRQLRIRQIAFYDDALLAQPHRALFPFLQKVIHQGCRVEFHTPNGLNARLLTPEAARLMIQAGFRSFFLGFESASPGWQEATGGKLRNGDLGAAVGRLIDAGADPTGIAAYLVVGHPRAALQSVEDSIRFAAGLGIRVMLSEFSPIPGTPDGELFRDRFDLGEPLHHNKIASTHRVLGAGRLQALKDLAVQLNHRQPETCLNPRALAPDPGTVSGRRRPAVNPH